MKNFVFKVEFSQTDSQMVIVKAETEELAKKKLQELIKYAYVSSYGEAITL